MKNASQNNKPGHVTKGDIFDDLGFSSTESLEAKIKADIWQALMKHIELHGFSQAYLVTMLKVHQPDVSNLLKGKISKVSITKLIQFAGRLNLDARVKVTSPRAGKNIQTLRASSPKSDKSRRELIRA
ncbi:MAG TPA: helix-turn-helix transcriptional regulator [Acidobacteriaceae bacterium]